MGVSSSTLTNTKGNSRNEEQLFTQACLADLTASFGTVLVKMERPPPAPIDLYIKGKLSPENLCINSWRGFHLSHVAEHGFFEKSRGEGKRDGWSGNPLIFSSFMAYQDD